MKKKFVVFMIIGILLIVFSGNALAASNTENPVPPASSSENLAPANPAPVNPAPAQPYPYDEAFRQMYDACHGPNGFMSRYYGQNGWDYGQNGWAPQNYGGMMNRGYGNMMGF